MAHKFKIPSYPDDVTWLLATEQPIWLGQGGMVIKELVEGDITWTNNYDSEISILLEGNRYGVNADPKCFKVITKEEALGIKEETVAVPEIWRYKTKEEFLQEGRWNSTVNAPDGWGLTPLNHLLGTAVSPEHIIHCRRGESISLKGSGVTIPSSGYMKAKPVKNILDAPLPIARPLPEPVFSKPKCEAGLGFTYDTGMFSRRDYTYREFPFDLPKSSSTVLSTLERVLKPVTSIFTKDKEPIENISVPSIAVKTTITVEPTDNITI